jgi:hypothetical protein
VSTGPADDRQSRYGAGIAALSFVSFISVLVIAWGELTGHRLLGGGVAVGVVLMAYSFILLFLRKGGFTGV